MYKGAAQRSACSCDQTIITTDNIKTLSWSAKAKASRKPSPVRIDNTYLSFSYYIQIVSLLLRQIENRAAYI